MHTTRVKRRFIAEDGWLENPLAGSNGQHRYNYYENFYYENFQKRLERPSPSRQRTPLGPLQQDASALS